MIAVVTNRVSGSVRTCSSLSQTYARPELDLDMDWIHPRIGLDWIGLGPMEKNRPNRVAS